jgi:hypothetical protein
MYNDLNGIKNLTTNPTLLKVINNMLEKLDAVKPAFLEQVKVNPCFAFSNKLGNFGNSDLKDPGESIESKGSGGLSNYPSNNDRNDHIDNPQIIEHPYVNLGDIGLSFKADIIIN